MNENALRPSASLPRVWLYREAVDFRKSYRWLSVLVEQELGHNPFSGELYVFRNRSRNRIKILLWEANGFVLYYKAFAEQKFRWPRGDEQVLTLDGQQLNWLLDGYDIAQLQPHKKLSYEAVG